MAISVQLANATRSSKRKTKICNDRRYRKVIGTFTVKGIRCRRLTDSEILERFNCSGLYQENRSAFSIRRARLNARRLIKASRQAISKGSTKKALAYATKMLNRRSKQRKQRKLRKQRTKRGLLTLPGPGETIVCSCVENFEKDTQTNFYRVCGECSTIYQQQLTPRRIPQFINEIVCNPNESPVITMNGFPVGECVQQFIKQVFWEATGYWVWSPSHGAFIEEFVPYQHKVKSGCAFQSYFEFP